MMLRPFPRFGAALLATSFTLCGCNAHKEVAGKVMLADSQLSSVTAGHPEALSLKARRATLAYEHTVALELPVAALATRVQEVRAACDTRSDLGCTVIDVSFGTEYDTPRGRVRLRISPASVDQVIELAAKGGTVTARGSHAEDLAEPISDAERQLAMLTTHRDRLSEFLKRNDLKVDQIISLSKEISSAQTQIDAFSTTRANLQRRVDTDLLTINFTPPRGTYETGQTPILDALHSFGSDFREAVASVIRFVAILVPWLVIIVPGLFLVRLFWRGVTRWIARRNATG